MAIENEFKDDVERKVQKLDSRIEKLKTDFNMLFAGELKRPEITRVIKEREELEKALYSLAVMETRIPRLILFVQNLTYKFHLYNNIWLKKLNEMETVTGMERKKVPAAESRKEEQREMPVTIGDPRSFETFYETYQKFMVNLSATPVAREKMIQAIKAKMTSHRLKNAKVQLKIQNGKLDIKIKK